MGLDWPRDYETLSVRASGTISNHMSKIMGKPFHSLADCVRGTKNMFNRNYKMLADAIFWKGCQGPQKFSDQKPIGPLDLKSLKSLSEFMTLSAQFFKDENFHYFASEFSKIVSGYPRRECLYNPFIVLLSILSPWQDSSHSRKRGTFLWLTFTPINPRRQ